MVLKKDKESSPIPRRRGVTSYCWVRGGVSFHRSYHLVCVIPSPLSAIGWGDCCYSSLHATLSSAIGWGAHTLLLPRSTLLFFSLNGNSSSCVCCPHRSSSLHRCVGPCCMPLSCSSPWSHHVACVLHPSCNSCCRGTILPACRSSAM